VGLTVFVVSPHTGDGQLGLDKVQPPGVGPILASVMGQFQDRAILDQLQDVGVTDD
jgi:hypothetical protein